MRPHDKQDNYYEYLEWCTHKENIKHSTDNMLQIPLTCQSHGMATITDKDVHCICKYMEDGLSNKEIIKKFEITDKTEKERFRNILKHIRKRNTWKPISKYYKF